MKIIALGASSSSKSINKRLAAYAARLAADQQGALVEVFDLNDFELPLFSQDTEERVGQPDNAKAFLAKISEADGIIISFAEHNGNFTAAWKNLFDWCSRAGKAVFQETPMIVLSTAPGDRGGASVMEMALNSLPRFGTEIRGHLSVPSFHENFNTETNELVNPKLKEQLEEIVTALTG